MADTLEYLVERMIKAAQEAAQERYAREAAEARVAEYENQGYMPGFRGEVARLIQNIASDRKIEAIKTYRMLTGEGLKESKDAIETVTNRLGPRDAAAA